MPPDEKPADGTEPAREPYEKPTVAAIDLFADEVLGVGCKVGGEMALAISTCAGGSCSSTGS